MVEGRGTKCRFFWLAGKVGRVAARDRPSESASRLAGLCLIFLKSRQSTLFVRPFTSCLREMHSTPFLAWSFNRCRSIEPGHSVSCLPPTSHNCYIFPFSHPIYNNTSLIKNIYFSVFKPTVPNLSCIQFSLNHFQ